MFLVSNVANGSLGRSNRIESLCLKRLVRGWFFLKRTCRNQPCNKQKDK